MGNKYYNFIFFLLLLFLGVGCASAGRSSSSTSNRTGGSTTETAAEDLSKYRPQFNIPAAAGNNTATPATNTNTGNMPTRHANAKVTTLLDTATIMNKSIRYAEGYRILAYSGIERKAAMDIRNEIVRRVPEEKDYLQYKQPTYRLKIGDYFSRIEAQQVLLRIKDVAPSAIIVADQINVK